MSFESCITSKNTVYLQSENFPISVKTTRPFEPVIKSDNILSIRNNSKKISDFENKF